MTAIACRDGIMAADSGEGSRDFILSRVMKIHRLWENSALVALAGSGLFERAFLEWLESRSPPPIHPACEPDSFDALMLLRSGEMRYYRGHGLWITLNAPFYAIGCADIFLTGAMAAGASAEQAVHLSIDYVAAVRGPVQVERL